jgi:hypothetical protein
MVIMIQEKAQCLKGRGKDINLMKINQVGRDVLNLRKSWTVTRTKTF